MSESKEQVRIGKIDRKTVDARVAELIRVLSERPGIHKSELHKRFTKRWKVHWVTVDRYVIRARSEMLLRLRRSKEDFRVDSLSFYEAMLVNSDASVADKIHARKRIDELLGLDAPRRQEISGPDGGPIPLRAVENLTEIDLREIASAHERIAGRKVGPLIPLPEPSMNGNGNGNGHH